LPLSRYIHRNPAETKPPLVTRLETYPWSSYATYINHTKAPKWLHRAFIYDILGHHQKYKGYQTNVEARVDDEIKELYHRGHTAAVIGDQAFITWVQERKLPELADKVFVTQVLPGPLSMTRIIRLVADCYKVEPALVTTVVKGPRKGLLARKVAMYCCQQLGGYRLRDIMPQFGLSNIGSVSFITTQIRKHMKINHALSRKIQTITRYILKHAT